MFYKFYGVKLLVYDNEGKLLILKRADSDKDDAGLWDIPGGEIENGETIYDAVKREAAEEAGIELSEFVIKDFLGTIIDDYNEKSKLVIAVLTCRLDNSFIQLNFEHTDFCWIDPKEISSFKLGRVLTQLTQLNF